MSVKKAFDIFLSYGAADGAWARRLMEALSTKGVRVWSAETDIVPGASLAQQMETGLRESDAIVLVVTPETVRSPWMLFEMGAALGLAKPVIPIIARDTPLDAIPSPIRSRKHLAKDDPEEAAAAIAQALAAWRGKGKATA